MKELSPTLFFKVYQKTRNIRIIDVRDAYDFNQYHLTYSVNIPAQLLYDKHNLFLNKRTTYYIICRNGEISKKVTKFLDENGYQVINIIGGLDCLKNSYHITFH